MLDEPGGSEHFYYKFLIIRFLAGNPPKREPTTTVRAISFIHEEFERTLG
jgi:hypothetical protein